MSVPAQPNSTTLSLASKNLSITVLSHGATLASIKHNNVDLVLSLQDWTSPTNPCMNCVIGRIAGRTRSPITIDGLSYDLPGCDGGGGGIKEREENFQDNFGIEFNYLNGCMRSALLSFYILSVNV